MISRIGLVNLRSLVLVAVGLFLVLFASQDVTAAGTYNPYGNLCLNDVTTPAACDGAATAGAITDVRSTYNIDEGDYNFYGNVSFLPPAVVEQIDLNTPIGAVVGQLNSISHLGLLGNPCNSTVDVEFIFLNASTNISDEIDPKPPGTKDVQEPLALDTNNNGIPDGADKYPSYLNNLFDFDLNEGPDGIFRTGDDINGPLPPLTPVMRSIGITKVPGAKDWIVLQFVIFQPGSKLKNFPSFNASLGYPSATVLQDPSAPASQSAISDFCTALETATITFGVSRDNPCTPPGANPLCPARPPIEASTPPTLDPQGCDGDLDESGCVIRKNPANGAYQFSLHTESRRDADGDGIENFLDTCPFDATPAWNPRDHDPLWDPDGDGLVGKADGSEPGCDPQPTSASPGSSQSCPDGLTGPDYDQDCFSDRQDNCPLKANNQVDGDKDDIGDACDPNPANADTEGAELMKDIQWCLTIPSSPIAEVAACPETPDDGDGTPTPTPTPVVDTDGDTVPDATDQCPGTAAGATVDSSGCSEAQLAAKKEETKKELLETLTAGMNLTSVLDTVTAGGSTDILAVCADDDAKAIPGVDITFKIDSQPGSNANLDGKASVTKTSDADGVAEAKLTAGTKPGKIVVSASGTAEGCEMKTIEVTVAGETTGDGDTGGDTGVDGGADTGVGSLAPAVSSIPAWAAIASALGGAGLLGSLGALVSRILRRRPE